MDVVLVQPLDVAIEIADVRAVVVPPTLESLRTCTRDALVSPALLLNAYAASATAAISTTAIAMAAATMGRRDD